MTVQDDINTAAQQPPDPQPMSNVEQRAALIEQAGGGYIDPALQTTLAAQPTSNDTLTSTVHAITGTVTRDVGTLTSSVRTVFADPVLYKQPTAAMRLHQFLTQQMGWQPVAQVDLNKVQQQLQKAGYGHGLSTSGVWTGDWQDAFTQASTDHFNQQRSADAGKGMSVGRVLHGFLGAFAPSHVIPALIGAVKAFPAGLRQLAADSVGGVVNAGADLIHGNPAGLADELLPGSFFFDKHPSGAAASVGAAIENVGNHRTVTAQDFAAEHGWQRAVENVNTLLAVAPIGRLATVAKDAAGQAVGRGLFTPMSKAAAMRGPGVLSNLLYRPAGYVASGDGVDYLAGEGGLLGSRVFDHIPALKQLIPLVRDGVEAGQRFYYYTARPFVAAPYRLPAVQAAGAIGQQVMFTGALLRGDANAMRTIEGKQSPFANEVLAQRPYTGPVGMALDLLGAVAHGPLTARASLPARTAAEAATQKPAVDHLIVVNPSKQVGEIVRQAHNLYDMMLGQPGVIGAWERGTNLDYQRTLAAFREAGLDQTDLDWGIQSKVDELAAGHGAAQQLLQDSARGIPAERNFRDLAMQIRQDPAQLSRYRGELVDSDAAMAQRFAQDHNRIIQNPKASVGSMVQAAKARRVAYRLVNDPNLSYQNVHPGTFAALRQAQEEHQFATAVDSTPPEGAAPSLTAAWNRANNPETGLAAVGIARLDTILSDEARAKAAELRARTATLHPQTDGVTAVTEQSTAAEKTLRNEVTGYLLQLGVDGNSIPATLDGRLALLDERANDLASKVAAPLDPTPEYTAARQELNTLGYELVHGTGIGFEFTNPAIDPVLVSGGIRTVRKAAERLGLGSTYADTMEAAQWHHLATIRSWQKLIDSGDVTVAPGYTPSTLYRHVYDNAPGGTRLSGARGAVFKAAEKVRWRRIAQAMLPADASSEEVDGKLAEIEKQLAGQRSLLDLSRKDFHAAATAPANGAVNELRAVPDLGAGPVSVEDAEKLRRTMVAAIAKRPAFIFGGAHLEDLLRAGGASFLGARAANSKVISRLATVGNDYTRFRNTYRFGIDPEFSLRRITKTALKLSTEGVPFSATPYESMMKQGTLRDDIDYYTRLFPQAKQVADGFDPLDQTIYQADLIGMYNPLHHGAYGAGWLRRNGLPDSEVKQALTRATTYGSRTALERTVGTIFYPFSFEKTLYRQVGARLLDNPGQRFMFEAALQAWDALNKNDRIGHWATAHAPILTELQKLNAFSHGVGPGQLGGINAPLASAVWNTLRPQLVTKPTDHTYQTLTAALPMLSELNSLLYGYSPTTGEHHGGTLTQQLGIGWQAAQNELDDGVRSLTHNPRSPWNPQAPAQTYATQQDNGYALRNNLIIRWASTIDYNYHHPNGEAKFPTDGSVPASLAGLPVTKSTIDEVVHMFYPDFDPTKAQTTAVAKKTEEARFIRQLAAASPERGQVYQQFASNVDKFISYKNRAELDQANWQALADWTQKFRAYATSVAEQDPGFYRFYKTFYQSQLGPLEALTG